jgi:hypothetical protein
MLRMRQYVHFIKHMEEKVLPLFSEWSVNERLIEWSVKERLVKKLPTHN